MLTPHILKMPDITAEDMIALDVGTVTQPRLPSLTVSGPNATEPVAPRPNAAAACTERSRHLARQFSRRRV